MTDARLILGVDQHRRRPNGCRRTRTFDRASPHVHPRRSDSRARTSPFEAPIGCQDPLREHLGQRAPEAAQQREAQAVDADVVVFPVRARRMTAASASPLRRLALDGECCGCGRSRPICRTARRSHSEVFCNKCRHVTALVPARFRTRRRPPSGRTGSSRSAISPSVTAIPASRLR